MSTLKANRYENTASSDGGVNIDSSGRVLLGTDTARSAGDVNASLQVEGTDFATSSLNLISNAGASAGNVPHISLAKSRGTSDGESTAVASGDNLGTIQFCGADGTDLNSIAASISAAVDGTPGGNDMPGRIVFSTTADGASSPTERMRIHAGGTVSIPTGIELGSGLDGTSANTLDDYEEGDFSPTYVSGLTSDTYSNTGGHYTKIGNFVTFTIRIAGAGTNSGSEQVQIGNLPFVASSSTREGGAWFNYRHDLDTGGAPFMHITQGGDDILWYGSGGSSWVGSDGNGLDNKTFHIQGFYYTDS